MELGLSHKSIRLLLEDALRQNENVTKEDLIEAIVTVILMNNKAIAIM